MNFPFDKKFEDIAISDIQALISGSVMENQSLEFKKEVWARSDEGIREMLRDISSLANAYGGYLIVGLEEDDDGKAIVCHEVPNVEEERDRIFSSCISNLQPRIIGLDIKTIPLNENGKILLIRIPNSPSLHQIIFGGLYQFWKRHDRQKAKMSIDEIKDAILRNESGKIDAEKFLERRHELRKRFNRPFILSALPVKTEKQIFDISDMGIRDVLKSSQTERYGGWNFNFDYSTVRPSLDGLRVGNEPVFSKTMDFFRNGYLEGYSQITQDHHYLNKALNLPGKPSQDTPTLRSISIVESIYSYTKRLKDLLNYVHYDGPYIFLIGLYDLQGFAMPQYGLRAMFQEYEIWQGGDLVIGPEVFEEIDPEKITKYLSDRIWQAFGFESEPFFKDGKFDFSDH